MPYLTGDAPSGICVLTMRLPSEFYIDLAVRGALSDLLHAYNWEKFGTATPLEISELIEDYWYTFTLTCSGRLLDSSANHLLDASGRFVVDG